jgi:hypothetical protein
MFFLSREVEGMALGNLSNQPKSLIGQVLIPSSGFFHLKDEKKPSSNRYSLLLMKKAFLMLKIRQGMITCQNQELKQP